MPERLLQHIQAMPLKRKIYYGLALLLIIFLIWPSKKEEQNDLAEDQLTLAVETSIAEPIREEILLYGKTEPNRTVDLKSKFGGFQSGSYVEAILIDEGNAAAQGALIMQLDKRDLPEQLQRAQSLVLQRDIEFQAAQRLFEKKLESEASLAAKKTALDSAIADLAAIQTQLEDLAICAPFDGFFADRAVNVGQYLKDGDTVGTFVELDPLIVRADLTEQERAHVSLGMGCEARTVNGNVLQGKVTYIAPVGDPNSRTFRIEVQVPNPDSQLPAGQTTELRILGPETLAHKVSKAHLALSDAGDLVVKSVDEDGTVSFYPAQIIRFDQENVWLGGLPEALDIITYGQGFVTEGQRFPIHRPSPATPEKS